MAITTISPLSAVRRKPSRPICRPSSSGSPKFIAPTNSAIARITSKPITPLRFTSKWVALSASASLAVPSSAHLCIRHRFHRSASRASIPSSVQRGGGARNGSLPKAIPSVLATRVSASIRPAFAFAFNLCVNRPSIIAAVCSASIRARGCVDEARRITMPFHYNLGVYPLDIRRSNGVYHAA